MPTKKPTLTEVRITQDYTIQLIEEEMQPEEKTPARTIERLIHELRTLRKVISSTPQPAVS